MSRFLVALTTTFIPCLLLSATMSLGPAREVAPPQYAGPLGEQRPGAVATDGTDFLVAWNDVSGVSSGLHVAAVTRDGVVNPVPQQAIAITHANDLASCWTGSEYLVVWNDLAPQRAMIATFSRDAQLIGAPRVIDTEIARFAGGMACTMGSAMLAYFDRAGSIHAALLDATGRAVRTRIGNWAFPQIGPQIAVATDGRDYTLFFDSILTVAASTIATPPPPPVRQTHRFLFARVRGTGEVVDSEPVPIATLEQTYEFDVEYGAGRHALVAVEMGQDGRRYLRRVLVDTTSLDNVSLPPIEVFESPSASVFWNGREFVAYWMSVAPKMILSTVAFGTASDAETVATPISRPGQGLHPRIVTNGDQVMAVWMDRSADTSGGDVSAVFLDAKASREVGATTTVSVTATLQAAPAIAASATEMLVAWHEHDPLINRFAVRARRLSNDGVLLDETPVMVGTHSDPSSKPVVVDTGSSYLVFFSGLHSRRIYVRLVRRDGTMGTLRHVADGFLPGKAASNRGVTLFAFAASDGLRAIRLSSDGEPLDQQPLLLASSGGHQVSTVSNGRGFLVVYERGSDYWQLPSPTLRDVMALRLGNDGLPLDSQAIEVAASPANEHSPVAAGEESGYLILHSDESVPLDTRLAAKHLSDEGVVRPLPRVSVAPSGFRVDLASAPNGYFIAWQTYAVGGCSAHVARLDREGEIVADAPALARTDCSRGLMMMAPAIAAGAHRASVAYVTRVTGPDHGDAARVFVRTLTSGPTRRRSAAR